ncbi:MULTISPECIES: ABC transporter permease [Paenibacillus]|uniref:ABC transporter permease n=1 Tax=Paenibacillus agri TaxID=2744309 RepID=A0A850EPD5_9BACL|nr:ABC transporter permease [Paenibacillus agri]NUU63028.1 ABC transporter permease [Paenibacillus agri]
MTFSLNRLLAIAGKEWKDSVKNPQILLMAGMPIVLSILMKGQKALSEGGTIDHFTMPIMIAISVVGAFVQALMISEEKEKNTLRALMLSPASPVEVLLGKSTMTTVYTIVVMAVCMLITGVPAINLGYLVLFILLLLVIFMALGTSIGLISRTASETSIVGLPILLFFVFGPIFAPGLKVPFVMDVIGFIPSYHFMEGLSALVLDKGMEQLWLSLGNLLVWTVLSMVLVFLIYGGKRFDK